MIRLRWELSKALGRPLHDPIFEEISNIQWIVYAKLLTEDRRNDAEGARDKIEYMARFIDNKAVNEMQRIREETKGAEDSSEFDNVLKRNFGRGIGSHTTKQLSVKELGQRISQANRS